jgi:hypothetical protein
MNADKHGSAPKKKRKVVTQPGIHPAQRVYFCSRPIPEIPSSPPFSKGGLGGISEDAVQYPNFFDKF